MGPLRQLDQVSRQLLAGAWAAGAGPGDDPLTIDLDSTLCETYGVCKESARNHGYTGQLNVPANSHQLGPRASLAASYPAISLATTTVGRHRRPKNACRPPPTPRLPEFEPGPSRL